jgi:hypothetical protein
MMNLTAELGFAPELRPESSASVLLHMKDYSSQGRSEATQSACLHVHNIANHFEQKTDLSPRTASLPRFYSSLLPPKVVWFMFHT